jgi:hypothetical protein
MARNLSVCMQRILNENAMEANKENIYWKHTSSDAGKISKKVNISTENKLRNRVPK